MFTIENIVSFILLCIMIWYFGSVLKALRQTNKEYNEVFKKYKKNEKRN